MPQSPDQFLEQAVQASQRGALAEAETQCRPATDSAPENFQAWYMLAVFCHLQRRGPQTLAAADAALQLDPASADALNLKGAALRVLDCPEEALACFTAALRLQPGNAEMWLNRSSVLGDLGRSQEAMASVDETLRLKPDHVEAWNNRAAALRDLKRPEDALESCNKALALRPDYVPALRNKAALLCESFQLEKGMAVYVRQARLNQNGRAQAGDEPAHKEHHDAEQRAYLAERNIRTHFHLEEGARLKTPAINPANAVSIAAQWKDNRPQIVVVDDLLSPEALAGLQRFCRESTVWRRAYDAGYLGATPETGFACPLLAQIADELRDVFPAIFEAHPLRYLWGFKYDSSLSGIDVHADFAAINVNFWITPDEANLDPQSGGLVLWDVAAPKDWDVVKYNRDAGANRQFLEQAGARPITIPYRANRAVIFDSDLFHKTDQISFKPGYLNRRINVTMLYGDR